MSPEMNRFMARRSKNEEYMERHLVDKRSSKIKADKETQDRLMEQEKNIQIYKNFQEKKQETINDWLEEKIAKTYIKLGDNLKDCNFDHKWVL